VTPLILLVVTAMASDLVTFALVVPLVGGEAEMNPIMRNGYATFGVMVVALLKATCTLAIVLLVLRCRPGPKRWLSAGVGIFIGVVGVIGNTTAFIMR